MLDCKKLNVDKKKTETSKPAPWLSDTTNDLSQLANAWESKKNASSKPQAIEHAPRDGIVKNLNLNCELSIPDDSSPIVEASADRLIDPSIDHTSKDPLNPRHTPLKDQ